MKTSDFDYNLPAENIAQLPASPRDHSRLLVFNRARQQISHDSFFNLDKYLNANDVLVFNQSKVFPARLKMYKPSGGEVEVFLLKKIDDYQWECMIGGRKVVGKTLELEINNRSEKLLAKITQSEASDFIAEFNYPASELMSILETVGETPLPPYIKTADSKEVRQQYQTVYAKGAGSVAAPTAGLHFTDQVFEKLKEKGITTEFITLHVGAGTFLPVKTEKLKEHQMHAEFVEIETEVAERLNKYKQQGKRIIAVGTTTLRALEAVAGKKGELVKYSGEVNIFITPGYRFKFVDSLITNFHLPKSTLLMLVGALMPGWLKSTKIKKIKQIYQTAIKNNYRFYSFGDSMFID